jgi:hypothetical protein
VKNRLSHRARALAALGARWDSGLIVPTGRRP